MQAEVEHIIEDFTDRFYEDKYLDQREIPEFLSKEETRRMAEDYLPDEYAHEAFDEFFNALDEDGNGKLDVYCELPKFVIQSMGGLYLGKEY